MCLIKLLLKIVAALLVLLLLAFCVLHFGVLPYYDAKHNAVTGPLPKPVTADVRALHEAMFVADMHADALLWGRDLANRYERGHVDLPRLRDGGIDLQVFSVVTKVPSGLNYHANSADSDILPLLFIAALRPPRSWFSPFARALVQAHELRELADRSALTLLLRRTDLDTDGIKGLLSLEGLHALEDGGEQALQELHAAGYRMMGLAHFFDNAFAGSAHGLDRPGLSEAGRALVPEMERLGITIDLAHASPAAIRDVLALAVKPVVSSHGGVRGTCPGPRNLSDDELRTIAGNGGVVGIGYWKGAVCEPGLAGIVDAILYTIEIAGIDHVGLGSDFDGHVATPFDTTALPALTDALLAAGLPPDDVRKIMGENLRRVLTANLP